MIVSKEKIYTGIEGEGEFIKKVNFTSKTGMFSIELPVKVAGVLGYEHVFDAELNGVNIKFHEAIKEYKQRQTNKRKVIMYNFMANCRIFDVSGACVLRRDDISFTDGTALGLWWGVGYETVFESKVRFTTLDGGCTSFDIGKTHKVIEWNPKREEFFRLFGKAMEELIMNITKFFSDEKEALNLIDNLTNNIPALPFSGGK